jgi:hypothetical protein
MLLGPPHCNFALGAMILLGDKTLDVTDLCLTVSFIFSMGWVTCFGAWRFDCKVLDGPLQVANVNQVLGSVAMKEFVVECALIPVGIIYKCEL